MRLAVNALGATCHNKICMHLGKSTEDDMSLRLSEQSQWAYDLYQQAVRNTWFPHEIPLKDDLTDWNTMTEDEKHSVSFLMGFL